MIAKKYQSGLVLSEMNMLGAQSLCLQELDNRGAIKFGSYQMNRLSIRPVSVGISCDNLCVSVCEGGLCGAVGLGACTRMPRCQKLDIQDSYWMDQIA